MKAECYASSDGMHGIIVNPTQSRPPSIRMPGEGDARVIELEAVEQIQLGLALINAGWTRMLRADQPKDTRSLMTLRDLIHQFFDKVHDGWICKVCPHDRHTTTPLTHLANVHPDVASATVHITPEEATTS